MRKFSFCQWESALYKAAIETIHVKWNVVENEDIMRLCVFSGFGVDQRSGEREKGESGLCALQGF